MESITEKFCDRCGELKSLDSFWKDKSNIVDRRQKWCIQCCKEYRRVNAEILKIKAHESYVKNIEKHREYRKKQHAQNKEKRNAACKEWYYKNQEYIKKYRQQNKDRISEQRRLHRERNPNYNRVICNRRRARKVNAAGAHTVQEWESLLEKYSHKCLKCGSTENITEDHVLPLNKGGSNFIQNIQPLCESCNSSKQDAYADYRPDSDRYSFEYLLELGKLPSLHSQSRSCPGEKNGHAKITEADVYEIRNSKELTRDLAKRFGLSVGVINKIKRKYLWKHLP